MLHKVCCSSKATNGPINGRACQSQAELVPVNASHAGAGLFRNSCQRTSRIHSNIAQVYVPEIKQLLPRCARHSCITTCLLATPAACSLPACSHPEQPCTAAAQLGTLLITSHCYHTVYIDCLHQSSFQATSGTFAPWSRPQASAIHHQAACCLEHSPYRLLSLT